MAGEEAATPEPRERDLVVDLSHMQKLDITSLALLLTAQRQAKEEDRDVWLAGVPLQVWEALDGLGLGRFFKPFPVSGPLSD
jgi:ABC-type transporter Mla MlaB component